MDVDATEIIDGEAQRDELDEPAVAPATDGTIFCYILALSLFTWQKHLFIIESTKRRGVSDASYFRT